MGQSVDEVQGGRRRRHRHRVRRGCRHRARPLVAGVMTTPSLPRLVATDLDGTLLDDDGRLSERTRDVLLRVQEQGVRVVIVTARPLRWMDELWAQVGRWPWRRDRVQRRDHLRHREPARCSSSTASRPRSACRWSRRSAAAAPGTTFALECLGGYRHEPAYVDLHPTPPDMRLGDLGDLWDEPAVKVLAQHLTLDPDDFRTRAIDAVGQTRDSDLDRRPPDGDQCARGDQGRRPGRPCASGSAWRRRRSWRSATCPTIWRC